MIDLRSDTLTRPTPEMRRVMAEADVNDDVIDVDPTVEKLQATIAEMLNMEAAMFMPSGTMTNQVAVRLHCSPGDEILCERGCHIYNYEQGGFAQLSGVIANTITGNDGVMTLDQLKNEIKPNNEHAVRTRLLALENTHNKGGGVVLPYDGVEEICSWAKENGLRRHLDGARLFNAVVASEISADSWAQHFDTVSVCFSKGLGAPVGSALAGPKDAIEEMRRHRKLFGGGMRQSGIIAAGALYALENNIERLKDDHLAAQVIADAVQQSPGLHLDPDHVDTNIVIFKIDESLADAPTFCKQLNEAGVWVFPFSHCHVRVVTHSDVTIDECRQAGTIIRELSEQLSNLSTSR